MSLQEVLEDQLRLARGVQRRLLSAADEELTAKEYKDLAGAASSILSLAHRTEEAQRLIATQQLVIDVVLQFLLRRSDTLGRDLLAELKEVAAVTPGGVMAIDEVMREHRTRF